MALSSLVHFAGAYARAKILPHYFSERLFLEQYHDRKIISHVRWVRQNSPFYEKHWRGMRDRDWRQLPVVDKAKVMGAFDEWNTRGIGLDEAFDLAIKGEQTRDFSPLIGDISVGLSSGTSGHRGVFLVSPDERLGWAGAMLAKVLPKGLLGGARIAFFLRASSNLYESARSKRVEFRYFDMLRPIEEHLSLLETYAPTVIIAPPSVLRQLVESKLAHRPQRILSVAEKLEASDEDFIAAHFRQEVHQGYQATEGFIAASCSEGSLHINEDIVHVQKEWIDDERYYPIITDFLRLSQPIVRYRLNDILHHEPTPCSCGSIFARLKSIEGRSDDVFQLQGKSVYPDFIRRALLSTPVRFAEYRVKQTGDSKVVVSTIPTLDTEQKRVIIASMQRTFGELGVENVEVEFGIHEVLKNAQKLRRVINENRPTC